VFKNLRRLDIRGRSHRGRADVRGFAARTDKVEKDEAAAPPMDDVGGPKTTSVLKEYQSTKLGIVR
jgi:hypothetical protein